METENKQVEKNKKSGNKIKVILVLLVAFIFAIYTYGSYRAEYLEISEIGEQYIKIFEQNKTYLRHISIANFAIVFLSIYVTNKLIKRGLKKFFDEEKKEMPKLANKSIAFIFALVITVITSGWLLENTMKALNATQFCISDPIFNSDIGFYIFQKPFVEMMILYFIALMIGLSVYIGVYHIVAFNMFFESIDGKMLRKSIFIRQLLTNAMVIIIAIAALVIVRTQGVVFNSFITLNNKEETAIVGAGLTEKFIEVWGYRILALIMVGAVFIAIRAFNKNNSKKVIISLMTVPVYLIVMFIVMVGFQFLYVNQNELDKQKEYISKNIEFTKTAYNINIDEVEIDNIETLTSEQVEKYKSTISNVPIVTSDVVLSTLTETQGKKGYYTYNTTRPNLKDSKLVYISAREIANDSRTYNNKTYEYTHGYGTIITSASEVGESGDLLHLSTEFNYQEITQPRIYYGLETNDTVVINKDSKEFDYPISATQNAENSYDGEGGFEAGFADRLIVAVAKKDMKLSFVDRDSSILINRNIIERAKKIMPQLTYDQEPYLVITEGGELVWVLDAYTTSDQYPYSQTTTIEQNGVKKSINYIRNSVKVLINAYNGTVDFYITDRTDPIIVAYDNMYPEVFKDASEIPSDISSQFVYSKLLYNVQSQILEMYHDVSTDVLYRGDDIWNVAMYSKNTTTTAGEKMTPYYTMVKTIDSDQEQLGLVLPYTMYGKQSMIAYLVGTTNRTESKLTMYRFSQDNNVLGPLQLNNTLSQDETISADIESLSVLGTRLSKNVIVVPVDNTFLYVVPIYQLSLNETQSTPVLKRVIVASGTKVAIGNNVEEALKNLLSDKTFVEIEVENTDTVDTLIDAIIKANHNLDDSSNIADWEQMGKDIERLQNLVNQLEVLKEQEKQEQVEEIDIDNKQETKLSDENVNNIVNTAE